MVEEKEEYPFEEQIYTIQAEVLVLGFSPKDAEERLGHQVFVNQILEDTTVTDWSHRDKPLWTGYDPEEEKQKLIKKITWEINRRERRR